jgi:hypothetical protein
VQVAKLRSQLEDAQRRLALQSQITEVQVPPHTLPHPCLTWLGFPIALLGGLHPLRFNAKTPSAFAAKPGKARFVAEVPQNPRGAKVVSLGMIKPQPGALPFQPCAVEKECDLGRYSEAAGRCSGLRRYPSPHPKNAGGQGTPPPPPHFVQPAVPYSTPEVPLN